MPRSRLIPLLAVAGGLAFAVALLSLVDIFVPRPHDGVVLEADAPGTMRVREVLAGSGAARAGVRAGDRIVGIDRSVLRSPAHAAELLARHSIGDSVAYLVHRDRAVDEVQVELGRRYVGSASYFFACLLGFAFFGVGVFVLRKRGEQRAAQIFYLLSALFLLFLVCRLRPASYRWVDLFSLHAGALALMLLPACFLHLFLVFPSPIALRPGGSEHDYRRRRRLWLALLATLYLVPVVVPAVALASAARAGVASEWISGAPKASWWVLGLYLLSGLVVLAASERRLSDVRQRRGVRLVLFGSLFGLTPFLAVAVARPAWLHTEPHAFAALGPLALVPITFAVAIVRFGLLDVRILVRRSLVYTAVTIAVAAVYAGALALFSAFAAGSDWSDSPGFPLLFALAVLVLFEPLRNRTQALVDRFVLGDRRRLQDAVRDLGRAMSARLDLQPVVRDLVEGLPRLLGLRFSALYLENEGVLERTAGPESLAQTLPMPGALLAALAERRQLVRVEELGRLAPDSEEVEALQRELAAAGVERVGALASPRAPIGVVLLSGASGTLALGAEELALLDNLLGQAAVALETSRLVGERTRQAELERELEIASSVQAELLPRELRFGAGWRVAAVCRPARHVGGDFFAELPVGDNGHRAIVFGDVAGKSVSGALVMMAAHEALQSLALTHRDPEALFELANRRLYGLGSKKSFVALAWVAAAPGDQAIDYLVAGQPQLLVRSSSGAVRELPLPPHRLPLGALLEGGYRASRAALAPGDLVLGYSDGVLDAQSPAGEPFGEERLTATLAAAGGDPDRAVAAVLEAVAAHARGAVPYDDITLVAIARDPEELQ